MPDKKPSFSERRERMSHLASELKDIGTRLVQASDEVADEADRMTAAEKRFSARNEIRQRPRTSR